MRRRDIRIVIAAALLVCAAPSLACTCVDSFDSEPEPKEAAQRLKKMTAQERVEAESKRDAEFIARRFSQAKVIVRGKITSLRAGEDVLMPSRPAAVSGPGSATFTSARAVTADFKVMNVVKGEAAERIKLFTGFGTGDCGIAPSFLIAVAWDREVSFAVQHIAGAPESYAVDMCGYAEMHSPKPPQ